jgi:predicted ATPase/DNA-binding NarL/FixJ family response regulator
MRNLPIPSTPLIGRAGELANVRASLLREDVRLLTLTGAPGIGKTRLALQLAADVQHAFADGVRWVPLAPIQDATLVLSALAHALDVREAGAQSLRDTLLNVLEQKQLLLVLDSFEHVAAAAPELAGLLEQASGLKLLTTSRAALHVAGEHIWSVPPLTFPDLHNLPTLDRLAAYPAVQLFVERAQAVQQDFALTDDLAPLVAAICAQLQGVPLAIELAAARSRVLPPQALLERLGQRLALLSEGAADAPERQQSLRAAIGWSYELLSAEEQALLRRLGVFVGGWTLDAAEAVCQLRIENEELRKGTEPQQFSIVNSQFSILDGLAALVDQSLVQRLADAEGEPRFTMLETIREFALEQLEASSEAEALRQQHAIYYLQFAETAEPHLQGPNQVAWLRRLEAEHDNLRAALAWSQTPACDAELALRLAVALYQFWQVRGYWSEGRAWLAPAVERNPHAAPALAAPALARASRLARDQDDYAQATLLAEQCLPLARTANHTDSTILALDTLGGIATVQGNFVQATQRYKEALALARQIDDQRLIGETLGPLGRLARIQGDLGRAEAYYNEALRIGRKVDNARIVVRALWGLGSVARDQGEYRRASALFAEGLALARSLGFKTLIAQILNGLGEAARLEQDYAQAAEHYRESLQLFHELGDKGNLSAVLHNLGHVALHRRQVAQAAAHFAESLAIAQAVEDKRLVGYALVGLGVVAAAQEQPRVAVHLLSATAAQREAIGYQLDAADQSEYDHYLTTARTQLDSAVFDVAWAEGQALALEQAIAEAVELAHTAQATPDHRPQTPLGERLGDLTEREREVLRLLAQGLTNPQIAEQLIISPRTVHAHLRAIYGKLEVSSRSAATRFAVEHGLV